MDAIKDILYMIIDELFHLSIDRNCSDDCSLMDYPLYLTGIDITYLFFEIEDRFDLVFPDYQIETNNNLSICSIIRCIKELESNMPERRNKHD